MRNKAIMADKFADKLSASGLGKFVRIQGFLCGITVGLLTTLYLSWVFAGMFDNESAWFAAFFVAFCILSGISVYVSLKLGALFVAMAGLLIKTFFPNQVEVEEEED